MRIIVLILFIVIGMPIQASEFSIGAEKVVSITSEKTITCSGYNLKAVSEEFPYDYEDHVPSEFAIKEFYGSPAIVSKDLYLVTNRSIQMPRANDIPEINAQLDSKRTYLPTKAYCKGDKFVVHYWSGGNCDMCELFVEYTVLDQQYANPKLITYKEAKEFQN